MSSYTPPPQVIPPAPLLVFSFGDSITAPAVSASGKYRLRQAGPLGVWFAELVTAGTTTTVAQVKRNGAVVGTVNLVNGDTEEALDLSAVTGAAGDLLTVTCTQVGTAALGLTILAPVA